MIPLHRLTSLLFVLFMLPIGVAAQDGPSVPALLVADDVIITGDDKLIAVGNVEALYEGQRLQAEKIIYDKTTDSLEITGPIRLNDGKSTLILADSGELDRNLENGILRGARIVFDDQLQLAAHQVGRTGGRYNQLYKASITSCKVCDDDKPPLWQIRARRVIHDQEARQLYFHDAQFRILDTPVFYLPRLRLPDPTLDRATGFLIPSLHNSSTLGFGARVPFFIRLGDHRDLTLTPFITTNSTTLEYRYRQKFRTGSIEVNGAFSNDDIGERSNRGYIFANGRFNLPRDFVLTFDIEAVNDDTYLLDYDFSDKDRLDSEIAVERARRDEYIRGALTAFRSLRVDENNSTQPTIVGNAEYERRFFPSSVGGELRFAAAAHSLFRSSNLTTDGSDFDSFADGRDVTRLTGSANWFRTWTLPIGLQARVQTGLDVDGFRIDQAGNTSRSSAAEVTPTTSLQFRLPVSKTTNSGVSHVIEPLLQLAWIGGSNPNVPNDESTRVEFDEGNLLSLSRFPSTDRRERGASVAYGASWTRFDRNGWQSKLTFGQVIRDTRLTENNGTDSFSDTSGLQGTFSDYLFAGQLKTANGLTFIARSTFDDDFDATKAEARAGWKTKLADIGATFIWLQADPAEDRPGTISEIAFDGSYRISRHWTGSAEWRYDITDDRSIRAGLGMKYTNECVDIALSASRRFTSSTILEPSTSFNLTVALRGFSSRTEDKSFVRKCKK